MAIGDLIYGQYGLTEIDSYSSTTMASEIVLDVQDASENNSLVVIMGSAQSDVNSWGLRGTYADANGTSLPVKYRQITQSTTGSAGSDSSTTPLITYYTATNLNSTTYDPTSISAYVGIIDFTIMLSLDRSTSAPIKRPAVFAKANNTSGSGNYYTTYTTHSLVSTTVPRKYKIWNSATGNITANIKVYSLFART